jgi:hypothetical protein
VGGGGGRSVTLRNALLTAAPCTNAAPLFCVQAVIPDGAAVAGAPRTACHCKVVPVLGAARWGRSGMEVEIHTFMTSQLVF